MNKLLMRLVLIAMSLWFTAAASAKAINCTNRDLGNVNQTGPGGVTSSNCKASNLVESGSGSVALRNGSDASNVNESENGRIVVDGASKISSATENGNGEVCVEGEISNLDENGNGRVIIKPGAKVSKASENGNGDLILCEDSEVSNAFENGPGSCRYEPGALFSNAPGCRMVNQIAACDNACGIEVSIEADEAIRELPDRTMFGQNLSFTSRSQETWNPVAGEFKQPFWDRFMAINPGLLRYPAGNWCYGFHFNLARRGIPHWVNTGVVNPLFRPQDFLKMVRELPNTRAMIHLSPIWSSPKEAVAFIAYMIGSTTDDRRIGHDSWGRFDPDTRQLIDWGTVADWAKRRIADGENAYAGTLYFQVGNEDWFDWCGDGVCDGSTDYYGRVRPKRQMTVTDERLVDPVSGVPVEAYWPNYRNTYLKVREFFDARQVQIGALIYAKPDGQAGADSFFSTAGTTGKMWNVELLRHLNNNTEGVTADFVTLHTYMYDKSGWERDFPLEGAANVLYASDHLAARIDQIFRFANSRRYSVMVTEFNIHIHNTIAPSSLLSALFYIDYTTSGLMNKDITGMLRWQTARARQSARFDGAHLFATDGPEDDTKLWKMSSYYAARLLGNLHRKVLETSVEGTPMYEPHGLTGQWISAGETLPWWTASKLPIVTAVATLSDNGKELVALILNKKTDEAFDVTLSLDDFSPMSTYEEVVLNTTTATGHNDIFKINPWRLARGRKCVPENGGCTRTLEPETGEKVVVIESKKEGASEEFYLTVPAHSAMVLKLAQAANQEAVGIR